MYIVYGWLRFEKGTGMNCILFTRVTHLLGYVLYILKYEHLEHSWRCWHHEHYGDLTNEQPCSVSCQRHTTLWNITGTT